MGTEFFLDADFLYSFVAASNCDEDVLADMEVDKKIVDIDNYTDPHICALIVRDIYRYLRESEVLILFHSSYCHSRGFHSQ